MAVMMRRSFGPRPSTWNQGAFDDLLQQKYKQSQQHIDIQGQQVTGQNKMLENRYAPGGQDERIAGGHDAAQMAAAATAAGAHVSGAQIAAGASTANAAAALEEAKRQHNILAPYYIGAGAKYQTEADTTAEQWKLAKPGMEADASRYPGLRQRNEERAGMEHKIDMFKLTKQLEDLQKGVTPESTGAATKSVVPTPTPGSIVSPFAPIPGYVDPNLPRPPGNMITPGYGNETQIIPRQYRPKYPSTTIRPYR